MAEVLVHQLDVEFVQAGLDQRVDGEDVARSRGLDGFVEGHVLVVA